MLGAWVVDMSRCSAKLVRLLNRPVSLLPLRYLRATIKMKEAPAQGRTIFEYAPESNAASDYGQVVDLLIDGPQTAIRSAAV